MSSHQSNKDKLRASKCHHFCRAFNIHNFCPTCREAGKEDDPCVTFISPCDICASFSEEQLTKITHRKRYVKKPDQKSDKNDQELYLLGDNSVESFVGSQADLLSESPRVLILSSRWTLIMAQPYLHASTLILVASMTPRFTISVLLRNARGCPRQTKEVFSLFQTV